VANLHVGRNGVVRFTHKCDSGLKAEVVKSIRDLEKKTSRRRKQTNK